MWLRGTKAWSNDLSKIGWHEAPWSAHVSLSTPAQGSSVASLWLQIKSTREAIDVCSEAHQTDPRNANVLRDRAEAYILNQEYEKGEEPSCAQKFMWHCDGTAKNINRRHLGKLMGEKKVSLFLFSCGGLQRGTGLWWQAGNQRRSRASAETAENLPEEGLLQDPRRQQVTGPTALAAESGVLPLWICCFHLGAPTSRRSSKLTGSWRSSGTPITSSPRRRRRRRRRSLSTSPRLKRSWPTQVRGQISSTSRIKSSDVLG